MAAPLTVSLPPELVLWEGCTIQVAAINATTGAVVAGVNVSNVCLEVETVAGGDLASGTFVVVDPVLLRTAP